MIRWVRVCATSDLLPGEYKVVYDGDVPIAVFNIDGELY
ncbi:MAG: non-heme iron oxygenase ferredoxin subunit, partial [Proteobacteria bacterium]|nr:non-heme iron oxygenase ferredoxin subunit [Pseudomonadota bacterium]